MTIELSKQQRLDAVASIKRYLEENFEIESIGDMRSGIILDFFLEEVGPSIYNKAVEDAQARVQSRVADLTGELFVDEFQYWLRTKAKHR